MYIRHNNFRNHTKIKVSCFDQAVRYLSFRDHSAYELKNKLKLKEYTSDEISETLDRLMQGGYLDDAGYSARYAAFRVNRMRMGPKRVVIDLKRKGFSEIDTMAALLKVYGDDDNERNVAKLAAVKKIRSFKENMNKDLMKRKLYDYLMRRGFSADVSRGLALDGFDDFFNKK
ncbi:hypothetical protein MNBD_NITROSPINAE01-308 [hydrothermal vent metagenome]|uniref:Regulatory protein RecX n=1 Tax=hydrothermal vent metagenome TaxID=652676 RepID=A0A3B1CUC8_9ZZZZ